MTSWIKITDEAAHRALLPALTHVTISHVGPIGRTPQSMMKFADPTTTLKRLDELTLPEALNVIRALADERERILDKASLIAATKAVVAEAEKRGFPPLAERHGETSTGEHGST